MVFDGLMKRISAGSPALVHHSHSIDCNSLGIPKVIVFCFILSISGILLGLHSIIWSFLP
jgi:hypothetical protein